MTLVFGEFLKHRQLIRFLKTAQSDSQAAGFGSYDHNRGVRPVSSRNRGDTVADPRAVLAGAHPVPPAYSGISIRHMGSPLLMHDRYETNASRFEYIHRVHKCRAHDAENVGYSVGDHGLYKGFARGHSGHGSFPLLVSRQARLASEVQWFT